MEYTNLASQTSIDNVIKSFTEKGYESFVVKTGKDALEKLKELIPVGASVMNGSSVTLEQVGFTDYLASGEHKWNDLHAKINAENDKEKRAKLRRESVLSDFYIGSVHALAETGDFIIASNTGSQLPHVTFTSPNLFFVVSTKKIVPTLTDALSRLETHVVPLENDHMMKLYNQGTHLNKIVIFKGESQFIGRKVKFILVEEDLGF